MRGSLQLTLNESHTFSSTFLQWRFLPGWRKQLQLHRMRANVGIPLSFYSLRFAVLLVLSKHRRSLVWMWTTSGATRCDRKMAQLWELFTLRNMIFLFHDFRFFSVFIYFSSHFSLSPRVAVVTHTPAKMFQLAEHDYIFGVFSFGKFEGLVNLSGKQSQSLSTFGRFFFFHLLILLSASST